jgi:Trehalase
MATAWVTTPEPAINRTFAHVAAHWPDLTRPGAWLAFPLPHPYVRPGGFFKMFVYWDCYFILLGLVLAQAGPGGGGGQLGPDLGFLELADGDQPAQLERGHVQGSLPAARATGSSPRAASRSPWPRRPGSGMALMPPYPACGRRHQWGWSRLRIGSAGSR